tara:strand:+ start:342 stop:713 length:372 start_codon:yes stop_codon:yes gene_type:complete
METETNKECPICGLELSCKYTYKLNCSHEFHYECLIKTLQANTISNHTNKKSCPYCRERCGYLPPVNGLKKLILGVHDIKTYKNFTSIPCQHVMVRGKRKGEICNKNCKLGYNYCTVHCPKIN